VTVSIGAAALKQGMDAKAFFRAADEMLYKAKNGGRNKVCPALSEVERNAI
jgi:PleD family two-component response regulator